MRLVGTRPSAFARFGTGSWLVPPVVFSGAGARGVEFGRDVVVLELAHFELAPGARVTVGDGCRFGRGLYVSCSTAIHVGTEVSGSDWVSVLDGAVVDDGAYLGCSSVVGEGVRIGAGAYVGEGAVVLDDVAPHTLVRGNPAVPA